MRARRIESRRYGSAIDRALATARAAHRHARAADRASVIVLIFGAITLVLWAGARDVLAGTLDAGVLGQFVLYAMFAAGSVGGAVRSLGRRAARGRRDGAHRRAARRARRASPTRRSRSRCRSPMRGALRFEHVDFHYPTAPDAPALHDFTLDSRPAKPSRWSARPAPARAPCSRLLLRFYDPQHGRITLDGIDLRALTLADLRGAIALVPQDTVIFGGSAADNIRFGRHDASDDEVRAAARAAEAHDFIGALPDGYDT